ncbi:DUF4129 domain-containing protein [Streptacidiphilus sp. PB12-B1b]|uniref:DUF4129 domain-containing protein n=1 Tax=Streptacidiphilus sp. PB12-B1b TaxID=2705012 RepID=UPI001CDB9753|nr:DUF4129 domain-containing protein [Streptacidiphilus sp. PB12-B1b]
MRVWPAAPLLGLTATVGLALAAICLHAGGSAGVVGAGPLVHWWFAAVLVAGVGGSTLAVKYRLRQEERPEMSEREQRFTRAAFTGVFAVAACSVVYLSVIGTGQPSLAPTLPGGGRAQSQPPATPPAHTMPPSKLVHSNTHPTDLRPLLLTVVCVALAAVLGFLGYRLAGWLRGRGRPGLVPSAPLARAAEEDRLADAVSAGRLALRGEDTRAAVIACYAAMEESLAAGGVGRRASDSPADLLHRASGAGVLTGPEPELLADLFREARFSRHPMGPEQLRQARAALDGIDRALAAHQRSAPAQPHPADPADPTDPTDPAASDRPAQAAHESRQEAVAP